MLSYKGFLKEARLLTHIEKQDKLGTMAGDTYDRNNLEHYGFKKVSTLSGHHVYHSATEGSYDGKLRHHYLLHDPKTDMVHLHVTAHETQNRNTGKNTGMLEIHELGGSGHSPVKAHDFYHHLLKNHVKGLIGTEHSEGGQKVWNRLAKKPSVSVHGWDKYRNHPVNIDATDPDETHSSPEIAGKHMDDVSWQSSHKDHDAAERDQEHEMEKSDMHLVASLKPRLKRKA